MVRGWFKLESRPGCLRLQREGISIDQSNGAEYEERIRLDVINLSSRRKLDWITPGYITEFIQIHTAHNDNSLWISNYEFRLEKR